MTPDFHDLLHPPGTYLSLWRGAVPMPGWSRPAAVMREVAQRHGLRRVDLESREKARCVAWPRQECMYELRRLTKLSWPQIGRLLGGRDHTTAMRGAARHEGRLHEAGLIA